MYILARTRFVLSSPAGPRGGGVSNFGKKRGPLICILNVNVDEDARVAPITKNTINLQ